MFPDVRPDVTLTGHNAWLPQSLRIPACDTGDRSGREPIAIRSAECHERDPEDAVVHDLCTSRAVCVYGNWVGTWIV